jgi:superfamily II DNA/RNA helicase
MAKKTFFMRGCAAVDKNKKTYEEKAQETKQHSARLAEMQRYVDMSEEKRNLLLDLVLHGRSSDSDEALLDKGVIIYTEYIDVVNQLVEDFRARNIEPMVITGATKAKDRGSISGEFRKNSKGKVVIMSMAGAESLNMQASNEILLYSNPKGFRGYLQTIGRICRQFSRFEAEGRSFYIHYIIVEDTIDEYKPILLSSRKQLEEDILHADTIDLKEVKSFDAEILKRIRKDMLWKEKEKVKAKRKGSYNE